MHRNKHKKPFAVIIDHPLNANIRPQVAKAKKAKTPKQKQKQK